jgi:hypothetical protein
MGTTRFNYVWLLPLLERPYAEVAGNIQQALIDRGLPEPIEARDVSLREMVATGLRSGSTYWSGLAIGWVEQGFAVDAGLVELMDRLAEGKEIDQRTRHRAFALARRWDRTAGAGEV